ncbi:MAG TPA: YggT family protein [Bacilli bacterium]|nr:YggT family protein [Bacilli bacterium]
MNVVIYFLYKAMGIYSYIIIARILMSWVPDVERTAFGRILYKITEPYLGIFRRFIPSIPLGGAYLDLSPIVAIIAWNLARSGVASLYNVW